MVLSLLVILVPVALIVWFFQSAPEPDLEAVEVGPVLAQAQEESPYPVLFTPNFPPGLRPVRVRWAHDGQRWIDGEPAVGNAWQLGFFDEQTGSYVGLQQRDRNTDAFLTRVTRDGAPDGEPVTIEGRQWEPWVSNDGRTLSMVWRTGEMVAAITCDTTDRDRLIWVIEHLDTQ